MEIYKRRDGGNAIEGKRNERTERPRVEGGRHRVRLRIGEIEEKDRVGKKEEEMKGEAEAQYGEAIERRHVVI